MVSLTADGDLYAEAYEDNEDIAAVRYGVFAQPPRRVPPGSVYRFRSEPTDAEKLRVRTQAEGIAKDECRAGGALAVLVGPFLLPMVAAVALSAAVVAVPVEAAAVAAPPTAGILRGVVARTAPGSLAGVWRFAMSWKTFRYGDELVGHVRSDRALGSRDLHDVGGGKGVFVEYVTPDDEEEFFDRAVDADARVLPIRRNRQGRREITWKEMRDRIQTEDFGKDWDLPGPRTALWCIEFIDHEGLGVEGHHERFRATCKLQATDWGVQEHFQLCTQVKYALLVDQLDGSNLVSVESKFRRLQTIEYAHGDMTREADAKAVGGKMSLEEQTVFLGASRAHSSVMVCPTLLAYVREEVERDAKLAKALRTAREERDERRKQPKK